MLLLFILLEGAAFAYYTNSNSYTEAKIVGAGGWFRNGVSSTVGRVALYFNLRKVNVALADRVAILERELALYRNYHADSLLMTMSSHDLLGEERIAARVISSTVNRRDNYLIINRGAKDGLREGMGVITPIGEMVGVVANVKDGYSVVISVLNSAFKSSGRLSSSRHAGSIYWGGDSRYRLQMNHLSKYAEPKVGERVVTTNFSTIFPEGVEVGRVAEYGFNEDQTTYELVLDLSVDLSALRYVLVVGSVVREDLEEFVDIVDNI